MAGLNLGKYTKDAILIVFSILLALMIDKSVEAWQTNQMERSAREAIQQELARNEEIVRSMHDIHQSILERIDEIFENDSVQKALRTGAYFDFVMVTGKQSIAPEFASNTAWETARTTGIITEFEYAEIEKLTRIYAQQDVVFRGTLVSIVDLLFQRETHDIKNFDTTLMQFKLRFSEIAAQERTLLWLYEDRKKSLVPGR